MFDFPASPTNGQIFQPGGNAPAWQFDGTAWKTLVTAQGFRGPTRTVYATAGTFSYTPPAGCTSIDVGVQGGGGGGGGARGTAAGQYTMGGGGGGGCYAAKMFNVSSLTFPISVTVGAGGTGGVGSSGVAGVTGGTTSFGSLLSVNGGAGGLDQAAGTPPLWGYGGLGGSTVTGGFDRVKPGEHGQPSWIEGSTSQYIHIGLGGSSFMGTGGIATQLYGGGPIPGVAGLGYGAGGSGSSNGPSAGSLNGGNGTPGAVIITEYYTGDATYRPTTAEARNRIVNGAMQISQEWGTTVLTNGGGYYAADQWSCSFVTTGAINHQWVASTTPNGSRNRFRITVATADTSLAAGEYCHIAQPIEGIRVADFGYGTAQARQAVLRFGWRSPAGTYSVYVKNNALNRAYVANFTISAGQANTDTVQTLVIPGDTTGTWTVDNTAGMYLGITIANGTAGVAGWQAGSFGATASNTNGLATVNNVFELFDVGLYLDPGNTGVAPPWTMPDEAQELAACMRYWQQRQYVIDTASLSQSIGLPAAMRLTAAGAGPNLSGGGAGFAVGQNNNGVSLWVYQTTRALTNLTFNSRM